MLDCAFQGLKTYFHRVVLEDEAPSDTPGLVTLVRPRKTIFFKCQLADRRRLLLNRTKRANSFPFELVEPE